MLSSLSRLRAVHTTHCLQAHVSRLLRGRNHPAQVLLHFVCFTHRDGSLYELDGRKFSAINHGRTAPSTLLQDTCAVVKKYVEATNSIRFNLIALAPA